LSPLIYCGTEVAVSRDSGVDKTYIALIQKALCQVSPWREGDLAIATLTDCRPMPLRVVSTDGLEVVWAVRKQRNHRQERSPGLTPFVVATPSETISFTIVLAGRPAEPRLIQAYPGTYVPPLPWQPAAVHAPGRRAACALFWSRHARLYREQDIISGSETDTPPGWFRKPRR